MSNRIWGYDLIKALAGFFIVLYHLQMVDFGFVAGEPYTPTATKMLWSFCAAGVPLFFMINGALTVNKYSTKKIVEKIARLIFITVFWGLVIKVGIIDGLIHHKFGITLRDFEDFYWFFKTLAILYALDWMLQRLPKWCEVVIVLGLLIFPFISNMVWDIIIFTHPDVVRPSWGHTGFLTLYSVVYHRLGYHLKGRSCPKWLSLAMILLGLVVLWLEVYIKTGYSGELYDGINASFPTVGALLLSIGLFMGIKYLSSPSKAIGQFVTFLGVNVLGVYLFHPPFTTIIHRCFPHVMIHPILAILVALTIACAAAAITHGLSKSPLKFTVKL